MVKNRDAPQAEFLIRALSDDRPDDPKTCHDTLSLGPEWQGHIGASLRLPPAAEKIPKAP
jgi:hypothetical protein